uniref:Transposase n=2 Tax=Streptomyces TaxID=1883 RepID=A0AAU2HAU1_9ACTN
MAHSDRTPDEHIVDAAYITPARVQRAEQTHGITLLGPIVADHSRQAKSGEGFGKSAFTIDWDQDHAVCPRGKASGGHHTLRIKEHQYLQFRFARADCLPCPDRASCTKSADRPRSIAVLPRPLHEIQAQNRLDQKTADRQRRYAIRSGIEATLSQNVRRHGLRRTRYRGLAKTHNQHVFTAMACNLTRTADWITQTPRGRTRSSRLHTLLGATADAHWRSPTESRHCALAESFFGALKNELVHRTSFPTRAHAHRAIVRYIEMFYNHRRLRSALGYRTPAEVHAEYEELQATA